MYTEVDQAEHILDYCVLKGWLPKMFFKPQEVEDVLKHKEYAAKRETLEKFHHMLMDFTDKVRDHHYLEMVFGKIDEGPTKDMALVEATRKREVLEEAGHITQAEFVGFSDPFNGAVTALYKSHMDEKDMDLVWMQVEANRRPTGYEWRCPLAWYKSIPNINLMQAKQEKAIHETCNGKWYPFKAHPRMDKKNLAVLSKYHEYMRKD